MDEISPPFPATSVGQVEKDKLCTFSVYVDDKGHSKDFGVPGCFNGMTGFE